MGGSNEAWNAEYPSATAEKEIQHSENRAPLSISRNEPAVVLC